MSSASSPSANGQQQRLDPNGLPYFEVPADEVGRNMLDDDRYRVAARDFDFARDTVVVMGGSGYVGLHIARFFTMCGKPPKTLRLFDIGAPRDEHLPPAVPTQCRIEIVTGDLTDAESVSRAVAGATIVLQVASYGMSGKEMLNRARIRAVNLGGAENVIAACKAHNVRALVYTSSYNAVFCGKPFQDARDPPYPADSDFYEEYSRTKSHAERLVLAANSDEPNGLRTTALRMAGIYGVGEMRHFPRVIKLVRMGAVQMTIGGLDCRQDWVSSANTALAHVIAARQLIGDRSDGTQKVAGRAFPVSDHCPVNQYRMLQPLIEAAGAQLPRLDLPFPLAMAVAWILDTLLLLLKPVVQLDPILTQGEVLKVAVEHHFAPEASIEGLGYRPIMPFNEGIARTNAAFIAYLKEQDAAAAAAKRSQRNAVPGLLFLAALVAAIAYVVALHLSVWL